MIHWSAFPGLFSGLFNVFGWSSNGSGMTGQVAIHPAGNHNTTG